MQFFNVQKNKYIYDSNKYIETPFGKLFRSNYLSYNNNKNMWLEFYCTILHERSCLKFNLKTVKST